MQHSVTVLSWQFKIFQSVYKAGYAKI